MNKFLVKLLLFYIVFETCFLIIVFVSELGFGLGLGDLAMGIMFGLTVLIATMFFLIRRRINNAYIQIMLLLIIIILMVYSILSITIYRGPEG